MDNKDVINQAVYTASQLNDYAKQVHAQSDEYEERAVEARQEALKLERLVNQIEELLSMPENNLAQLELIAGIERIYGIEVDPIEYEEDGEETE